MESELSIQAVSRRSGVASSALRYYEERGLIASQRARSGHRRYPRAALRRIAFVVFCAADRIVARGDRRGARETSRRPDADTRGLVAHVRRVDETDRSKDRRASALESWSHAMHWMRVPLDRQMRIRQPSRSCGKARPRTALLAQMNALRSGARAVKHITPE